MVKNKNPLSTASKSIDSSRILVTSQQESINSEPRKFWVPLLLAAAVEEREKKKKTWEKRGEIVVTGWKTR